MNRFLTRRKGQDDDGGKKKKGKKGQVEPKPEFNISTALPKAEDFRTSLIMPGLSTRFSMLREQDDPNSKLGKASDDSVLQPKRQSRLHEFGFVPGGLSDIAEVSSLNGSIRPPFANERHGSFDSTRDDDGAGGIMSRARPGEGNVLFGGRQKIYKIPNAATSKGGLGRALYEDDVNLSTFQKLRQEEKEQRRKELEAAAADEQDGQHSEPSSPTTISQRRETSSSTNSGTLNTRTSTAATSIASQGANSIPVSSPGFPIMGAPTSPTELTRSTTKGRRLYDQGLDQHIHEQQSSAMNRLNSLQRSRAPTGRSTPPLLFSQTKSATNLNDRFTRGINLRTESPTPQGYPGGSTGKEPQSAGSSPVIPYPHSPPLASPLASDSEEAQTLHAAIKPHDRGKATAMGAFNKPKQAFNEQQYAERLKRMQQERDAPSSRPESPRKLSSDVHRKPSLEKDAPSKVSLENPRKPSSENPRKMTLRERAEMEKRRRAEAAEAGRQRSESSATDHKEAPSAFSVFQAAANRMKDQGPPSPAPVTKLPSPPIQRVQSPEERAATFLTSPNSSDDEEEAYPKNTIQKTTDIRSRIENIPVATGPAPPIFEHPALRSQNSSAEELEQQHPALRPQVNEPTPRPDSETNVPDADVDSPTLGPNNGGLSGLIRQHLRSISNVSSNYGEDQPLTSPPVVTPVGLGLQTQNLGLQRRQPASEADTPAPSSYSHSNPWDLDDIDNPYRDERDSVSSVSPVENHKLNPQTLHGAIKEPNEWEPEVKKAHTREPSAESHDEHEAFQRDLAQRQRIIQESLRAKAEGRSTSPAPGGLKTALSMLRAKSSRESFATVDRQHDRQLDHSMKAMKMLGISAGNSTNTSTASLATPGSDHAPPLRQKPSRVLQQSEQDAQREMANRQRSATNDSNNRDARLKGRSPPTSTRSSTRDRSSSEASSGGGRSRSRHRAYRDDLEQAMAEGTNRSTIYPANIPSPSIPGYVVNPTQPLSAERPSIDSQNQSQGRLRSRSNSRTTAANYFESKHLQPIHTGNASAHGQSPRLAPSPNVPTPQFSPGLPASPRPSPSNPSPNVNAFRPQGSPIPPFSANHTPPVSNPATPVAPGFSSPRPEFQPINKTGTLRKKSIAKSDISEPVFLSTTSVIDTVNLPPGASLKNGIDAAPPPVPPINPMRRRFGFGRSDQNQDGNGLDAPRAPYADPPRTNSSDNLSSQASTPRQRLRKSSSEGKSLHGRAQAQTGANPPMPSVAAPLGRNNSPPRPINQQHYTQQPMNGAMF